MITHYLSSSDVDWHHSTNRALCGRLVNNRQHDSHPSCPICRAELADEATRDAEIYAELGMEVVNGLVVPKETR